MEKENKTVFDTLYAVDVSAKLGKKMGLSYLSWADAWAELKKIYPDAEYKIYTRRVDSTIEKQEKLDEKTTITTTENYYNEVPYFTDGRTCYVKVGVTIKNNEEIEIFPIMNNRNASVPVYSVTSVDVNKALQRAFVKACARHGLGLYVYAGEDLPEDKRVDVNDLIKQASKVNAVEDEAEFNKMKENIISYITSLGDHVDATLYAFIQRLFPGFRLGQLNFKDHAAGVSQLNFVISRL
jgi:hypothetical protein